ncbi:SdpI family protein [Clavibacter nebraskensis]|uniref:SdpI family protein n=1 Tax=Clavibacter nebraskensis TaxID=31963 RepID=UPI0012FCFA81|nr:SdpI family protein [Clavibacter nebraskensis]QGV67442.1 SdpI family protein [Clavibacter nebraskensis]UQB13001.1 SdpI family protein [Clavibacter nebraskensis]UQB15836.1 SdpI family protein [Clavibacter nebraskensis]
MGVPALLLAVAALLVLGTTQLAAWGLLKRNGWIGIRTRPLMASDEAWRAGHAAALPALRSTCLAVAIGGVIGGIAAGAGMNSVASWGALLLVGGIVWSTFRAGRAAKAVTRRSDAELHASRPAQRPGPSRR